MLKTSGLIYKQRFCKKQLFNAIDILYKSFRPTGEIYWLYFTDFSVEDSFEMTRKSLRMLKLFIEILKEINAKKS